MTSKQYNKYITKKDISNPKDIENYQHQLIKNQE